MTGRLSILAGRTSRRFAEWQRRAWKEAKDGESSLRGRLVVLVLSAMAPATAVTLIASMHAWDTGRKEAEAALEARAQTVAAAVARQIDMAQVSMQALATSYYLAKGDIDSFVSRVQGLPIPLGARLMVTAPSGLQLYNSDIPRGSPMPLRGNAAEVARVFETGRPHVSKLYFGTRSGEPMVSVDVPARDDKGRVAYAVGLAFPTASFVRLLDDLDLPAGWSSAVLDRDGAVVARSGDAGRDVEVRASPVPSGLKAAPVAASSTVSDADAGVSGWTGVVAVSRAEFDGPIRRSIALAALGGALVLALGLFAAAWHAKRIALAVRGLAQGALALGRGQEPPPVPRGVREATRAAAALRRASASLSRRLRDREIADRRRGVVVAELNHRVKNVLATVQSVAIQTQRGTSTEPSLFVPAFNSRLLALSRAHDLLTGNAWEDTDLGTVVRAALAPWRPGEAESPVVFDCHRSDLPALRPQQAQSLVLALHELATNAAKHGALSRRGGRVDVSCTDDPGGLGALVWRETGGPEIPAPPERRGFGTRLLERGLARDLGPGAAVELVFEPEGLVATIRFPLRQEGPAASADRIAA